MEAGRIKLLELARKYIREGQPSIAEEIIEALLAVEPPSASPKWVINDLAELGVKIGDRFFWLYKGENLEYKKEARRYRLVCKREFGEVCHPIGFTTLEAWLKDESVDSEEWKNVL